MTKPVNEVPRMTEDLRVYVIVRDYCFPAGSVTHLGGVQCYPTEERAQRALEAMGSYSSYYRIQPLLVTE